MTCAASDEQLFNLVWPNGWPGAMVKVLDVSEAHSVHQFQQTYQLCTRHLLLSQPVHGMKDISNDFRLGGFSVHNLLLEG